MMKRVAWMAAMLVLVATLLWVGLRPGDGMPAPASVDGADAARAPAPTAVPAAAAAGQADATPVRAAPNPTPTSGRAVAAPTAFALPPPHSALRDIVAELQQEAQRGNSQAACRLGAELVRCQMAKTGMRYQATPATMARTWATQRLDEAEIERRTTNMLQYQQHIEAEAARCDGVDLQALAPPAHWFMQAADAGHVRSMAEALSPTMYDTRTLFRDPGLIPRYRARAERYFYAALEAGEPALLGAWGNASMNPDSDPLATLLPAPWRERGFVMALQELVSRARQPSAPRPPAPPPARPPAPAPMPGFEISAAQRDEAAQVFARYFEGRVPPAAPLQSAFIAPLERFDCESAPR